MVAAFFRRVKRCLTKKKIILFFIQLVHMSHCLLRTSTCLALTLIFFTSKTFAQSTTIDAEAKRPSLSREKLNVVTDLLRSEVQADRIAGAVAIVMHRGDIAYFEAVGQSDVAERTPMQKDAIFRIASMTKAITSAAVMVLVEEGKLSLNDSISKHLPRFADQRVLSSLDGDDTSTVPVQRPATIHDLLTHRSGLTYGWFGPEKLDAIYRKQAIPDLFIPIHEKLANRVDRIATVPLKFQPGTAWDYGVSTDVLGRIIEVVSGKSLDVFLRERFFVPLKMSDTYFSLPPEKTSRLATLYTTDEQQQILAVGNKPVTAGFLTFSANYSTEDNLFFSGGGGLVSTTMDYARFLQMLLNQGELDGVRVLKSETVDAMTRNQVGEMTIPFPGHGDAFGFGFGLLTERGKAKDVASVGTYSWGGIFNSYYWVDPKKDLIGVLMMQVFPNDHLATRSEFKRLVYGAMEPSKVGSVQLERDSQDESAGGLECYRIETSNTIYYLDKVGAGLSSMIDRDGHDWISFHPSEGSGAGGEYRGFPNAVFKEAGSYFHARNAGTDPCVTIVEEESPERVVISALSSNGKWGCKYTFTNDACTFTMTKKPANHNYWVLYEGTPGGQYDDSDWWMTSKASTKHRLTETHEGDLPAPEWIAFGDPKLNRTLVLYHAEDDESIDRFYEMQKKMTVFGFGRDGMRKFLDSVPQSFTIGFVESDDYEAIQKQLTSVWTFAAQRQLQDSSNSSHSHVALEKFALTSTGDANLGRELFFHDERTQCSTCHRVDKSGGDVGPDLSKIGGKFDRPHLVESLLAPSQQIVEGYHTSVIVTRDGRGYSGIVKTHGDQTLTLVDQQNKSHVLAIREIEEKTDTPVSLMPAGLADTLSPQEFANLLAYLETLRTDKPSFGSGVRGAIQLPEGFEITTVATGLSGATAMDVADDGRVFICEQQGTLRVVKGDTLLEQPFVTVPVELNWERGLIGVTLAPDFPADPYVYVVYVAKEPYTHHRVSRFRANGDVAVPNSEQILLKGDDQSKFGGHVPAGHQGGGIHFGADGSLYVGLGEQTAKTPSQRFDALQGKILRLNPNGSIPEDNPFLDMTKGKYQSIWAIGCRNPFTFAVRKVTGEMLINDVGGKFEEINRGVAGANYGWPDVDHGPTDRRDITGPIHIYPEASISGGDFSDAVKNWPANFRGKYFFADFVHGWIKTLDLDAPEAASDFAFGLRRIVDLRFGSEGSLYVLLRNAWVVDDKFESGTGSLVRIRYRGVKH